MSTEKKIKLLSPNLLAYIGDSVYELQVRTYLLEQGYRSLNKIHQATVKYVNGSAQAKGLRAIQSKLSVEEKDIVQRGRNSKTGSRPSNIDIIDYRLSTGLEALFGYHYLIGNYDRISQLWGMLVNKLDEDSKSNS